MANKLRQETGGETSGMDREDSGKEQEARGRFTPECRGDKCKKMKRGNQPRS